MVGSDADTWAIRSSINSASRLMHRSETALSNSSRSAKCRYAALCDTPAARLAARSTTASSPSVRARSSPASRSTQAAPPSPGIRTAVIISVDRAADVDNLAAHARAAGATLSKEPTDAEFFEGHDAYFADPEGNYWEIAWSAESNPVVAAARRAAGQPA
jgi:glyoxalase/bleomycin resistance protein/dioxygenase superfamily protein